MASGSGSELYLVVVDARLSGNKRVKSVVTVSFLTGLSYLRVTEIYSNKKETSDFHGTVPFDPVKMSQQKINQNVYQTFDTQKMVII